MAQQANEALKDTLKAIAAQQAGQESPRPSDPTLDAVFQNMQLADPNVQKIIKGEIHLLINKLETMIVEFTQNGKVSVDDATRIIEATQAVKKELTRYYRMVPFLLMLSPLMETSNLDHKSVLRIQSRQTTMVYRLRLDVEDEDEEKTLSSANFYDSIEILMHVLVASSEEGWKTKELNHETREFRTSFQDNSRPVAAPMKKRWKIF